MVRSADGEPDLLYIDLHLLHEVTSPQAFDGLRQRRPPVRRPDLTIATEDHNTPTLDIDKPIADPVSRLQIETLRKNCAEFGVRLHSLGDVEQGIVHVVGPQLGLTQPGMTVVCGDSHTSTHGAFGALAFGIGTSEVEHVLATQTLPLASRSRRWPSRSPARSAEGVTAKDVVLAVIAKIGTGGGQGYVIEYRGEAIEKLSMEGRMTVCNMSIEAGARAGMIAPDETTFAYLKGRAHAPDGRRLGRRRRVLEDAAHRRRRDLRRRGRHRRRRADAVRHLGHQPRPGPAAVGRRSRTRRRTSVPRSTRPRPARRWNTWAWRPARRCARSRWTRSSSARAPTAGWRTCAPRPPSSRAARSPTACGCWWSRARRGCAWRPRPKGCTRSSPDAGAEWRFAGCSMCLGMNPDQLAPGERSASTSNRNFEGRQGKGGRTHLVSPLVAAATAVRGHPVVAVGPAPP